MIALQFKDRPQTPPHPEQQYLDLLHKVWTEGDERRDRTGVGTRSIFGATVRYSLAGDSVPLLTTKRVSWKTATRWWPGCRCCSRSRPAS